MSLEQKDAPEYGRLLTPIEAATTLGISPRKLWELSNRKEIASVRIGRCVRYDPRDLSDFVLRSKS